MAGHDVEDASSLELILAGPFLSMVIDIPVVDNSKELESEYINVFLISQSSLSNSIYLCGMLNTSNSLAFQEKLGSGNK